MYLVPLKEVGASSAAKVLLTYIANALTVVVFQAQLVVDSQKDLRDAPARPHLPRIRHSSRLVIIGAPSWWKLVATLLTGPTA